VDATDGKILTWRGAPAQAFYFSSSGGSTEDVVNVWGSKDFPYLVSVPDSYESGASAHYSWETVYTAAEIRSQLLDSGVDVGAVSGVAVTKKSDAGRAVEVTVTGTKGKKVYTNESCRLFLKELFSQSYSITTNGNSYQAVDSTGKTQNITLEGKQAAARRGATAISASAGLAAVAGDGAAKSLPVSSGAFRFVGKGWGHAVGMSQEGAKGMADKGFSYEEILTHYFPGCAVQ
jgi:stage II sporulation protein D